MHLDQKDTGKLKIKRWKERHQAKKVQVSNFSIRQNKCMEKKLYIHKVLRADKRHESRIVVGDFNTYFISNSV